MARAPILEAGRKADWRRGHVPRELSLRHPQLRDWSTSLFFLIHGIIERSLSPTTSIECCAIRRRCEANVVAPARFSRMKLLAYSPVWMLRSASRIARL